MSRMAFIGQVIISLFGCKRYESLDTMGLDMAAADISSVFNGILTCLCLNGL